MSFSLEWLLTNLAADFLLPPLNGMACIAVGWLMIRHKPKLSRTLVGFGLIMLWVQAMPAVGNLLLGTLESPPLDASRMKEAQAIVVLGGGRYRGAPEYGEDTASHATLARLRYAAKLHRETQLPILVSGGTPEGAIPSEAEIMRRILVGEFMLPVRWVEDSSINTRENALNTANILLPANITRVLLVTDATHMQRSAHSFEAAGFSVLPAPTLFHRRPLTPLDFMARSYDKTRYALHEWIGLFWYRVRQ